MRSTNVRDVHRRPLFRGQAPPHLIQREVEQGQPSIWHIIPDWSWSTLKKRPMLFQKMITNIKHHHILSYWNLKIAGQSR